MFTSNAYDSVLYEVTGLSVERKDVKRLVLWRTDPRRDFIYNEMLLKAQHEPPKAL